MTKAVMAVDPRGGNEVKIVSIDHDMADAFGLGFDS